MGRVVKNRIVLFLYIPFFTPLIGQENCGYIIEEIGNFEKLLSKGNFERGALYFNKDSIEAEILVLNGRKRIIHYLFCIARLNNDSIIVYKPNEIRGYKLLDDSYFAYQGNNRCFFIKQVKTGRIDLYERPSIPDDNRFLYYLKMGDKESYFVINPYEDNVKEYKLPDSQESEESASTKSVYQPKGIDRRFKIFITKYFGDCTKVVNLVKSDFYTIRDMPNIVEIYNNCFE